MTQTRNNGGPAFPAPYDGQGCGPEGMSLKAWYMGMALRSVGTWIPAHGGVNLASKNAMDARACWAEEQANAMLKALKKGGDA